jgi:hypothetical protein
MRWAKPNLTFSYTGKHRYYGNAWQAAKNWTDLNTGITIRPAASGEKGDIIFDDVYDSTGDAAGSAASTRLPELWQGDPDWRSPYTTIPASPNTPVIMRIKVNQYRMDTLDDPHRTAALTHELGHALGLAHSDICGITSPSIMKIRWTGFSQTNNYHAATV